MTVNTANVRITVWRLNVEDALIDGARQDVGTVEVQEYVDMVEFDLIARCYL